MGDLIGDRYEVLESLWSGGDTEVARGLDRRHDRVVALKITTIEPGQDPAPLLAEGRLLLGLQPHPGIPTIRDDVMLDDRYVLVIDWIDGFSAQRILEERGDPGLPLSTVLGWLPDIAAALDHLHAQQPSVVHGDIRLNNVIVNDQGRAVLVYGAAALRNAAAVSIADDVYALSSAITHLLTGREPRPGEPIVWDGVAPELAKRLDRVLRRALDPDPLRRPASASELVDRIQSARETALPTGVVTFVLTDIVGSTPLWEAHPNEMASVIARHHELAADIAEEHGGRMPRSQGEGDSTLSAFARATDAAAAAIALQRALAAEPWPEGIKLTVRAGMHTGEAQLEQGDYLGAAVSRAARIRALAQGGQVLVSHATAELIADHLPEDVSLHEIGRFALAGLTREELVAELRAPDLFDSSAAAAAPSAGPASDTGDDAAVKEDEERFEDDMSRSPVAFPPTLETDAPFVGREAELATLRSWWSQTLASDRRRVVLLGGDAGMGKTRLAIELARALHDERATVLAGRCYQENVVPYQPFVEAIGWYLRTAPAHEVRADLVRTGSLLTRLVPDVAGDFADLPQPVAAEPDTQRYLMFEAVNDLLSTLATSAPVLLVLEDLHWADRPTLALLSHLARGRDSAALVVLGTYRDDEVGGDHPLRGVLTELRRDHAVDDLALTGLEEYDVARLCEVACAFQPDSEFVRSMRRETEGNPFFVREICSHLTELGSAPTGGAFTLETLGVPAGVKQVIERRVEHLPEAAGRVLSAAAVIGREFDLDVLVEITGDTEDTVLDLLDEAIEARVVEETSSAGRYSFLHALTREALHDSLSATRRARLHHRVARAIEELRGERLDEHLGVLAYHYAASGTDPEKAVEYARRAGEQSLRRLAHEEAAQFFERGLALDAAVDTTRCDLLFGLAEARRRAGDVTGARDAFIEAGAVARGMGDAERLARAAIANYRGHVFANPGWHEPAIDLLEEALTVLPDVDDPLRARVLAALGLEIYFTVDQERADDFSAAGVDMARRVGDDDALAFCLACRHTAIFDPGHLQDRLAVTSELIEVGARIGNPELELTGHLHRACDLLELARVDEVRQEAELCARMVEELGQPAQRYFVLWLQSTLALLDGHLEDAEKLARESFDLGVAASHPDSAVVYGTQAVIFAWQRGDTSELVEPTIDILSRVPALPAWRSALAVVLALGGRRDEARELLFEVSGQLHELSFSATWCAALVGLSEVARLLDEPDVAQPVYDGLVDFADRLCVISLSLSEMGPISRALGVLAGLQADYDLAERHLLDALETSERIGSPTHATRTRVDLARVLLDRGVGDDVERARALLERAIPDAQELGLAGVLLDAFQLKSATARVP
jgi:class 3 adenylate cyclase/tetratricopeptide (TPR) repeat protein